MTPPAQRWVTSICFAGLCAGWSACGGQERGAETPALESEAGEEDDRTEAEQVAAIARAMNEMQTAVHTCWARGAADDYRLEGKVILTLDIPTAGGPNKVEVLEDGTQDEVLTGCLIDLWRDVPWPEVMHGTQINALPFEFVAPDAQYTVAEAHVPVHSLADGKLQVRVLLDQDNTGNQAAAMSLLWVAPEFEVPLHRHPDSAELLYVVSGRGELTDVTLGPPPGDRRKAATRMPVEVGPGSAIYVPADVVHGFVAAVDEPVVLVQLYAPGGPERRFENPETTDGTVAVHRAELKAPKVRRGPRPIVRATAQVEPRPISGGAGSVRILMEPESTEDDAAYVGTLTARVGAEVPLHRHSGSTELLYVLEGEARMTISGRELSVMAGDAVQIPPGVEHGASVVGAGDFKALQYYAPSGPEQRFKGQ